MVAWSTRSLFQCGCTFFFLIHLQFSVWRQISLFLFTYRSTRGEKTVKQRSYASSWAAYAVQMIWSVYIEQWRGSVDCFVRTGKNKNQIYFIFVTFGRWNLKDCVRCTNMMFNSTIKLFMWSKDLINQIDFLSVFDVKHCKRCILFHLNLFSVHFK